jgi:hypothetical protein
MSARARAKPLFVTVVSANAETLDGLQAYLDEAGVRSRGLRALVGAAVATAATTAVVLFPDDFAPDDVDALLDRLRRARPGVLVVLVTREAQRFDAATRADGRSTPPLVLPRPSFGWVILDAVRAHASARSGEA